MSSSAVKNLGKKRDKPRNELIKPTITTTVKPSLLTSLNEFERKLIGIILIESELKKRTVFTFLVRDELLNHSNTDVRVAVASCIVRFMTTCTIFKQDFPYEKHEMRDVFELIVSSFHNLSDKNSSSYGKRINILEAVAEYKLIEVMLDYNPECEDQIDVMFKHFFEEISDYHPKNVFSAMEKIMISVIEKRGVIGPPWLVYPILAALKDQSQDLPIATKLGKSFLESCKLELMKDFFPHVEVGQKVLCLTPSSENEMSPQASAETEESISAAMANNEDGIDFLIKAMTSFPTKLADKSLIQEEEEDPKAIGTAYLTDTDNRELFLPFVHHFGWIVRPFVKDSPFLEEIRKGIYLSIVRFLREVAFVSCHSNSDAVLISNLQKCLKTMAETVKLNEDFVSFMSQYLEKRLVMQQAKINAALVRKYQA